MMANRFMAKIERKLRKIPYSIVSNLSLQSVIKNKFDL